MMTSENNKAADHWLILGGTRSGKSRYAEQRTALLAATEKKVEEEVAAKAADKTANKVTTPEDSAEPAPVFYIATSTAADEEMQQRIKLHQQQRPKHWQTIECPFDLTDALLEIQQRCPHGIVMIDCLTLWLTNQLLGRQPDYSAAEPQICLQQWQQAKQEFLTYLTQTSLTLVMVSNEVGQGITPLGRLSRVFVDEAGRLHQDIAAQVNHVVMVMAGLPLTLK